VDPLQGLIHQCFAAELRRSSRHDGFNAKQMIAVQFQLSVNQSFDVGVDHVAFYD